MSITVQSQPAEATVGHPVVLFDGVCNLCHRSVQFIVRRDPNSVFRFASLQSDLGQSLLAQHNLPTDLDTVVLVESERASVRSTAALRIAYRLGWPWRVMAAFLILPAVVRDPIYRFVARNRYRWFGQKDECPLPDPAQAHRFL